MLTKELLDVMATQMRYSLYDDKRVYFDLSFFVQTMPYGCIVVTDHFRRFVTFVEFMKQFFMSILLVTQNVLADDVLNLAYEF